MFCSDNILYYSYVAFETYKDLAEHLKQDATKKFIKCVALHSSPIHHHVCLVDTSNEVWPWVP